MHSGDQETPMAQIPFYLPDPVARELTRTAKARGMSVSRLLAELVRGEIPEGWPEGFFDRDDDAGSEPEGVPPEGELRDDV